MVVLNLDNSPCLTICGSGVLLMDLLGEEHHRDKLVVVLPAELKVDGDTARRDVDALIADLSDAGLFSR
ncbi:MAG: PqqD family protein [Pseudonocardiaceae bacterium]